MNSETIFLTGGTGVLGAHLLKQLLIETDSRIACLVRASSPAEGRERLRSFLEIYDPQKTQAQAFNERVDIVLGDVSQPMLGLNERDYQELAQRIRQTIHSAASTNLFQRFRPIEAINVGGVRNVIEFCLQTRDRDLCYVSTYTVIGDKTFDGSVVYTEKDYDIGQGFRDMSYQQTKFIGEGIVRNSAARGLKWNIVRPGQIFGESGTGLYPQGATNVSGLFYDIFKTIVETGIAFPSDTYFDITPVDYVSRGIVHLAVKRPQRFETYHLTNPDFRTYTELVEMMQSFGYHIDFVSQQRYREMLEQRELRAGSSDEEYTSMTTKAFKWWFRRDLFKFQVSAKTDSTYTAGILKEAGIVCPKLDHELLRTYVSRSVETGYFPSMNPSTPNGAAKGRKEMLV